MKKNEVYFVSEPVQHQGGVIADVMSASIASSNYSQAETFLRETLQNACDQKISNSSQIRFIVDMFRVDGKKKLLFDDFFANARLGLDPLNLQSLSESRGFEAMVVADVGTSGLVGPLDASIDETPSNFAGFFFNVGRQSSDERSGGAFGLGRTVLTNASAFSTILVYSQFKHNGKLGKRFMGMAIKGAFSNSGRRYTGRHWFGLPPEPGSGLVRPFENSEAEQLAESFGMRNYLNNETGFVAMVVGNSLISNPESAVLSSAQRKEAIQSIQQAACIYGWPHMIGSKKNRSVDFHFYLDGKEIPEKDPSEMPVLREYIKCYESLYSQVEGVESKEIVYSSGGAKKEPTGILSWLNIPTTQSDREYSKNGPIPISSIALLRQANFVVKYLEVTQKADQISTRGVFKANNQFDSYFRKSEPVAHDDWIPSKLQLKSNTRNPIKQTLDNIKETFKEIAGLKNEIQNGSASVVLGNLVGRLLDGLSLTGPPKPPKPSSGGSGSGSGSRNIQVVPVGSPKIISSTHEDYKAVFKFQVIFPGDVIETQKIVFSAFGLLDNGLPEMVPPDGAGVPEIFKIHFQDQPLSLSSPIELVDSMHLKYIEVTISGPQGVGSTCVWKKVE